MKNVLRRAIELLNLLSDNENLTTENIKDSISDYRDLNQQYANEFFDFFEVTRFKSDIILNNHE